MAKAKTTTSASSDPIEALIAKAVKGDRKVRPQLLDEKPAAVVPKLVALFGATDAKSRANAIGLATGTLPFAKLVPVESLIATLADREAAVRLAAVFAVKSCFPTQPFWKPHATKIRPALEPLLADGDKAVKEQAGHAWRLLGLD